MKATLVFAIASSLHVSAEAASPLTVEPTKLPISFEANVGQTDGEVKFLSRGSGYTLFLTRDAAMLSLRKPSTAADMKSKGRNTALDMVRIKLLGANPNAQVIGVDGLAGKSNYFIGRDPKKWRTDIASYARVKYQNIYPGIDLVFYGNPRQLECDFELAPGVDPKTIRLSVDGATKMRIDERGDLLLETGGGQVYLRKPNMYQTANGGRSEIVGEYVREGKHRLGFRVARYDTTKSLIIDPVLSYSTYLGGIGDDWGFGIALDTARNAYVTGSTASTNFPRLSAYQSTYGGGPSDVFVTKLNATGSALIYSTYLGGTGDDAGNAIAVDSSGNAYVTGQTSGNFPTTPSAFQRTFGGGDTDAFVAKLDAAGALVYSTYLGGEGTDYANAIAVDSSGNAYVTGQTQSGRFPSTPGAFQAFGGGPETFVTKLNAAGSGLVYSTFLHGTPVNDVGNGIAVDSSGNAYVTGITSSPTHPTKNAFQPNFGGGPSDAFVTKFNATGSELIYSTYLGGSGLDRAFAIAVDSSGSAYVTGITASQNFPTKNPFQAEIHLRFDAFVTKFDPNGALAYSTFLGGNDDDRAFGIAVDDHSGNAYVTGRTDSSDFPTERPIQPDASGGPGHAFVTELSASGNILVYSTYLGGTGRDRGFAIALDSDNNAYVAGVTDSTNFPTANPLQATNGGSLDAVIAKISDAQDDFTLRVASGSSSHATITAGQTAMYDLQVVSVNNFRSRVDIRCDYVGDAPTEATCSVSPGSVDVGSASSVSVRASVSTKGRSFLPLFSPNRDAPRKRAQQGTVLLLSIFACLLMLFAARRMKTRFVTRTAPLLFLLLAGCSLLPGPHTRPGDYKLAITGTSQGVKRTVNLALTVN